MKRRDFILGITVTLGLPGVASAQVFGLYEDQIVAQLQALGYKKFKVTRTWLGRSRIIAESQEYRREIILNPHTGEVLRDYWELIGDGGRSSSGLFDPEEDYDDEPDEDDEPDDDEEKDD